MRAIFFLNRKMDLRKVSVKYGRRVVFIRHDSAEIWGFRYGLTFAICNRKIMASTDVLMRVVCALDHSTSMILT
jgi:hypothetical protein